MAVLHYIVSKNTKHYCTCIDCGKTMIPFTFKRPPKRCRVCREAINRVNCREAAKRRNNKKNVRVCVRVTEASV
jgi:hypothetical protein